MASQSVPGEGDAAGNSNDLNQENGKKLTVDIPEQREEESEVNTTSSSWKKVLQSPGAFVEKTASFTKMNLANMLKPSDRRRSSVDPYSRAADIARYQASVQLQESETMKMESSSSGKQSGKSQHPAVREIHFEPKEVLNPNIMYKETNKVVTSKYNLVTFLPIFLFEMFTRVAYLYFLIQAGLSWWSVVSPYSGIGATMALFFVLIVAGIKAVWEDVKRHREDENMNKSITHRLLADGTIEDISWTEVKVGDAIVVRDDENFPADLLCLYSALPDNVCFIKTTNLDGETNLKIRKPVDLKDGRNDMSMKDLLDLDLTLKAEPPNRNLHKFQGNIKVRNHLYKDLPISPGSKKKLWETAQDSSDEKPYIEMAVTMNEMLLRGCTLKNSNEIVGLVVYTGKETRIQKNSIKTPLKVGSFDRFLNFQISLVILMQLIMCLVLAILNYAWIRNEGVNHPYLALTFYVEGIYSNGFVQVVINFFTFWILLSYLVPISLFVTLEIVKFWQGFIFINFDKMMRNPVTKEHAICRNSNLNEDLGKVEYIFSDKTGTLTSNEMQLRQISIKGEIFGDIEFRLEEHTTQRNIAALKSFDRRLAAAAHVMQELPILDATTKRGGSEKKVMAYHHSNPSIGTATQLGLPHQSVDLDSFNPEEASIIDEKQSPQSLVALGNHMVDFFTNICLCHSLILEKGSDEDILPNYQGPSPDEVALVDAARQLGFEFKNRSQGKLTLILLGKEVTFEVLNVMEYSSDRGCMSVIARTPDGSIRLYCKGADTKVMKKIREGTSPELLRRTELDLHTFAKKGLRTLVLGSKEIDETEYDDWDGRYQQASCLFEGRDDALDELGLEIERDLELIGVTAIEDKLQDGVPAAIETLLDAGIRVWMITGDKQETAVNIAVSCNLVKDVENVMTINVDDKDGDAEQKTATLLDCAAEKLINEYSKIHKNIASLDEIPEYWQHGELTIDGPTLNFVLNSNEMKVQLAKIAAHCSGVVVSRSSPSQKAAVVKSMTEYEMQKAAGTSRGFVRWYKRYSRRLQGKMLSIGDGANDVAMIQTADVGIGIMGKEGRQAVNSSDYAISQFRFLVPLLLVHGNLSYYRLSRLIKYSFYKNITFAFVMFFYQFFNGYSGQALVDSITAAMFNVVFTSLPILLFAVLDRPVGELTAFIRYPRLYDKRNSRSLTTYSFWKSGVLQGVLHGAVSFFVPYYCVTTIGKRTITDVYSLGKIAFAALLGTVTLEVALVARYWTWVFFWIVILSYGLMYPYLIIFPYVELALEFYDPANVGVAVQVLSSPVYWFVIILCYTLTFGSRFAEKTIQWVFRPHDTMILAEKERIEDTKGGLLANLSGHSKARLQQLGTFNRHASSGKTFNERVDEAMEDTEISQDSGNGEEVESKVSKHPNGETNSSRDSVKAWDSLKPGKVPV